MVSYDRENLAGNIKSRGSQRVVFASDLHGNQQQYRLVLAYASVAEADLLILGGDLLPKSAKKRTVEAQLRFFRDKLLPIIRQGMAEKNKHNPELKIVFIYGNDDFKAIYDDIKSELRSVGVIMISNEIYTCNGFDLIGYSYVPLTPFKYKDWEKLDYSDSFERHTSHVKFGFSSTKKGMVKTGFDEINKRTSISQDLERLFLLCERPVILVTHAPPYSTNLDFTWSKEHVGSKAIRDAILKYQPLISLHGHIHESALMKSSHEEILNKTHCFTSGNFFNQDIASIVQIDLKNKKFAKYSIIITGDLQALTKFAPDSVAPLLKIGRTSQDILESEKNPHQQIVLSH